MSVKDFFSKICIIKKNLKKKHLDQYLLNKGVQDDW